MSQVFIFYQTLIILICTPTIQKKKTTKEIISDLCVLPRTVSFFQRSPLESSWHFNIVSEWQVMLLGIKRYIYTFFIDEIGH